MPCRSSTYNNPYPDKKNLSLGYILNIFLKFRKCQTQYSYEGLNKKSVFRWLQTLYLMNVGWHSLRVNHTRIVSFLFLSFQLIGGSPNSLDELQNWSILYELSILPNVLFELLNNIQRLQSPKCLNKLPCVG